MRNIAHLLIFLGLGLLSAEAFADQTVTAGGGQSCAIVDGRVWCWGLNESGELGNGTTVTAMRPTRIADSANKNWTNVSAGSSDHTCALSDDFILSCWGDGTDGSLGNGTTANATYPGEVKESDGTTSLKSISDFSNGDGDTCAVTNGLAACWGANVRGQLGDNSTSDSLFPVVLAAPLGIAQITAGAAHTCAITNAGLLYCWGANYSGQLGDGTTDDSAIPLQTKRHVFSVSAGGASTCAILEVGPDRDQRLQCWGDNYYGVLGNNSSVPYSAVPATVLDPSGTLPLANISSVSVGGFHACAVGTDRHVYCWGFNGYGQLGNGTRNDSNLPVLVSNVDGVGALENIVEVSAGYRHTCARRAAGGSVYCWGAAEGASIGDGKSGDRLLPVQIDFDRIYESGFDEN